MPVAAVDVLNGFPFDGGEDLGVDDEVDETPLLPPSDGLQPQPVGVITWCYPLFGVTIRAVGRAVTATSLSISFAASRSARRISRRPCWPRRIMLKRRLTLGAGVGSHE